MKNLRSDLIGTLREDLQKFNGNIPPIVPTYIRTVSGNYVVSTSGNKVIKRS